jgi:hypothetical protein
LSLSYEKEKTEKNRREEIRNQKNDENCAPGKQSRAQRHRPEKQATQG